MLLFLRPSSGSATTVQGSFTVDAVTLKTETSSFSVDAVIATTQTGSFTADAIAKRTWTFDPTFDAVVSRTQAESKTLDAVLLATYTSNFTLDAITSATLTGSLSLDATFVASTVSAFTLDAVALGVSSDSFALDAIVLTTVAATFTLDATITLSPVVVATLDAVLLATSEGSFALDAILIGTIPSAISLDAIVLATSSGSFSLDAVLLATSSGGAALNAVLLSAVSGAVSLDAVTLVTSSWTFTLDAEVIAGGAGFALDAIIGATASSSYTLDAEIVGVTANGGSFALDAVVMKMIFQDTFTRTVSPGLGGPWTWAPFDSSTPTAEETYIEVGGSYVDLLYDAGGYESYVGYPYPDTGDGWFDFYVPSTIPANARPTYGFAFDPYSYLGVYVALWSTIRFDQFDGLGLYGSVTPTPGTWYRLHARWTTGRVMINVFKTSESEPLGWQYDQPRGFVYQDAAWAPPFFDFYWNPTSNGAGVPMVDNIEIWTTQSTWLGIGGFQLDAYFIKRDFTLDAFLQARYFYLDAYIQGTVVRSGIPANEPQFVAASGASSWTETSSIVVNKPSGTANGDFLIAFVFTRDGISTNISSSGWTARHTAVLNNSRMSYLFYRTASSDPSTYTFSASTAVGFSVIVLTFRGVTQINQETFSLTTASPYDDITTAYVDLTHPGMLVQAFQSASFNPGSMSTVSGMTEAIDQQDYFVQQAADYVPVLSVGGLIGGGSTTITNPDAGSPRLGWSVLLGKSGSGVIFDAVLSQRGFKLDAILVKTASKSFTIDCWIEGFARQQHSRGNVPHYNVDLDTVVVIASAIGLNPTGTDLHTVLSTIEGQISALEGGYLYRAFRLYATIKIPTFTLDAVTYGSSTRALLLDAIVLQPQSGTFTLDAALVLTPVGSFAIDAFVQPWFTLDAFIGGNTFDATAFEPTAFD